MTEEHLAHVAEKPLCRRTIVAAVKHLVRYGARLVASATVVPLASFVENEGEPTASQVDISEESAGPRQQLHGRTFADGSVARLDGTWCEADLVDLTVTRPDGSVRRGREALAVAHPLLLQERSHRVTRQASNARRATGARARDALRRLSSPCPVLTG